jgi:thiamine biosynthesis lipoprotein
VDQAFAELELVEQVMSIYRPTSQLCQLNRDRALDHPHPYLLEVLEAARAMSQRSDGAFDITVQPLWELFSAHCRRGSLPTAVEVEATRRQVGWRRVEISADRVALQGSATAITLNGIAQGFAVDKALACLRTHGIDHALLDTGEIGTVGRNDDGEPWTVGIQHPRVHDAFISLASLSGRCLATSGDYATPFSDDLRWHHIFDPRTGRSPTELASVSIAAPTGLQADALSTAVFVLGPQRGYELVRSTADTDALLVMKDGRTMATNGFLTSVET